MPKVTINAFKGYLSAKDLIDTPVDFLRKANNVFVDEGQIKKRRKFSSYALSDTSDIQGVFEANFVKNASNRYLIYKNLSNWRYASGATLSTGPTTLVTVATALRPKFKKSHTPIVYCVEGSKTKKFFVATAGPTAKFEDIGLPTPAAATDSGQLGAGGLVSGVCQYLYTWVESNDFQTIESVPSPVSGVHTITPGVDYVRLVLPIAPDPDSSGRINKARIYRLSDGASIYYQVDEIAVSVSATTTWNDNTSHPRNFDIPAPSSENTQPTFATNLLEWHKQRMFYAQYGTNPGTALGGNQLYWSEILKPEAVQNGISFINVGTPDDGFVALISRPQYLLIIKQRSLWMLEGSGPSDFMLTQMSDVGSLCPEGTLIHDGVLYTINDRGIFASNNFVYPPVNISDLIKNDFKSIIESSAGVHIDMAYAVIEPTYGHIWFALLTNFSTLTYNIFIYNPKIQQFVGCIQGISLSSIGKLEDYVSTPRLVYYDRTADLLKAYNYSGLTDESNITTIAFTTGALVEEQSAQAKLYRLIQPLYRIDSGQTENVDLQLEKPDGTLLMIKSNFQISSVGSKAVGIGRSSINQFGIQINGTSLSVASNKQWAITGMELEYEKIGVW